MKQLIITIAASLIVSACAAQSEKAMNVYVLAGARAFAPKQFNGATSLAPSLVPSIGGGAIWQLKRFQLGAEFSYLDGKKDTEEFSSVLSGINAHVLGGYSFSLTDRLKLSLQAGFGYNLHHLTVTNLSYTGAAQLNSTIYHNMTYTIPVSIWLQRTSASGVFTGLRVGYNIPAGMSEWRYIEGSNNVSYSGGNDGLYFQLVFGGLLNLGAKTL